MAAEPAFEPVDEAEAILDALPERWRAQFLEEYRQALDAAHEVWRFHQIRDVLRVWHLRAVAYSRPGFEQAARTARDGRPEDFVSFDEAVAG
ncbi:MAG TPA: DUF6247 family protein [Kribbellaceae bacterium]